MTLDPATEFLVRKDRRFLEKRLGRKEKVLSVVQARHDDHIGLLAGTPQRLLWVGKVGWRRRATSLERKDIAKITEEKSRYGAVVVHRKVGGNVRFDMLQAGAARVFVDKAAPGRMRTAKSGQVREGGPMEFKAKAKPAPRPFKQAATPTHDPLTATQAQKLARLERLKAKGMVTQAEYQWQKDALEGRRRTR